MESQEKIRKVPYVGLRAFTDGDKEIFFGREREAQELLSLLIVHPVVLLYAPSGAGKTSLLQAKVLPLLSAQRARIFGPARVRGAVPDKDGRNIFLCSALTNLGAPPEPKDTGEGSLSRFVQESAKRAKESAGQQAGEGEENDALSLSILVFDQFEEIFFSYPERWRDRDEFFDEVGAALEDNPLLRVVFSMREEYLASLDPYADRLPGRMKTRYRLELLRAEFALEAIRGPAAKEGRLFTEAAAEKLVSNLLQVALRSPEGISVCSGEFVDPVQLQLVCERLWRSLPEDSNEIDEKSIQDYGDVDQALEQYYNQCIREVVNEQATKTGLDENGRRTLERQIRLWFSKELITSGRTRGLVYQEREKTGGLPNHLVKLLEERRLVRAEIRGGEPWYELAHDRLIGPLQASNLKALADTAARSRIEELALRQYTLRQTSQQTGQPIAVLHQYVTWTESTPSQAYSDWCTAQHIFALEVLEGQGHRDQWLGSGSFGVLENEWLSDIKKTKGYLLWETRVHKGEAALDCDDYLEACRLFREALMDSLGKASLDEFQSIELYLSNYLDANGRFDPAKAGTLLERKAHRIWEAGANRGQEADWNDAVAYCRMFYDNVLSAVKNKDEECMLAALKTFQAAPGPGDRYRVVNGLEAAIAIYFFDPAVIQRLWDSTKDKPIPDSYPDSRVKADRFPEPVDFPPSLQHRLAFDVHSGQLVLRGALKKEEQKSLLQEVPEAEEAIKELFRQSRILIEEKTL